MHPFDISTTNALIAARREDVQRMMRESHRQGTVRNAVGRLLLRLGTWLKNDAQAAAPAQPVVPARKRPQLA